eukprot:Rhum_TRINITY_DN2874_c0_g1::Rhum_TRINITY_DN2874_c0_g1_i1::g.8698::m.8698
MPPKGHGAMAAKGVAVLPRRTMLSEAQREAHGRPEPASRGERNSADMRRVVQSCLAPKLGGGRGRGGSSLGSGAPSLASSSSVVSPEPLRRPIPVRPGAALSASDSVGSSPQLNTPRQRLRQIVPPETTTPKSPRRHAPDETLALHKAHQPATVRTMTPPASPTSSPKSSSSGVNLRPVPVPASASGASSPRLPTSPSSAENERTVGQRPQQVRPRPQHQVEVIAKELTGEGTGSGIALNVPRVDSELVSTPRTGPSAKASWATNNSPVASPKASSPRNRQPLSPQPQQPLPTTQPPQPRQPPQQRQPSPQPQQPLPTIIQQPSPQQQRQQPLPTTQMSATTAQTPVTPPPAVTPPPLDPPQAWQQTQPAATSPRGQQPPPAQQATSPASLALSSNTTPATLLLEAADLEPKANGATPAPTLALSPSNSASPELEALWARFLGQLRAEQGVSSINDVREASTEQIDTLVASLTQPPFTLVETLKIKTLWAERVVGSSPTQRSATSPRASSFSALSSPRRALASPRSPRGLPTPTATPTPTPGSSAAARGKRKKDLDGTPGSVASVPRSSDVWETVEKVVQNTVAPRGRDVRVEIDKLVQLIAANDVLARYDRQRSAMGHEHGTPKVLYFMPPSEVLPVDMHRVVNDGFNSFFSRTRKSKRSALEFATEVRCDAKVSNFVLCEVLTGRRKQLGPAGITDAPLVFPEGYDSLSIDYEYSNRVTGAIDSASRYFIGEQDRVIPRFSVFVKSISATQAKSPAPSLGAATPLPLPIPTPVQAQAQAQEQAQAATPAPTPVPTPAPAQDERSTRHELRFSPSPIRTPLSDADSPRGQPPQSQLASPPPQATFTTAPPPVAAAAVAAHAVPIMCAHHEDEELRLFCVAEKELTCAMCASVGRHAGKHCVTLSSLLHTMQSQFVHNESVVGRKLAKLGAESERLHTQETTVREASAHAQSALLVRVRSLHEEVDTQQRLVEARIARKEEQALAMLSLQQKEIDEQVAVLSKAHGCLKSLLHLQDTNTKGISHKAHDIISLCKFLDQDRPATYGDDLSAKAAAAASELTSYSQKQVSSLRMVSSVE